MDTSGLAELVAGLKEVASEVSVGVLTDAKGVHNRMVGERCRAGRRGARRGMRSLPPTVTWEALGALSGLGLCGECTWGDLELGEEEGGPRGGVDRDRNTFTQKSGKAVAEALRALRAFEEARSVSSALVLFDHVEELTWFSSVRKSVVELRRSALDVLLAHEEVLRHRLARDAVKGVSVDERLLGPVSGPVFEAFKTSLVEELARDASWSLSTASVEDAEGLLGQVFSRGFVMTAKATLRLVPSVALKALPPEDARGTEAVRFETRPEEALLETVAALFEPYGEGAFKTLEEAVEAAEELL
jgi:hypothetical protein